METRKADLLIIGGGINGVAVAADAAGRGLDVVLTEQDDLSSGTSSMSSKLIHGGLRYLEQREFGLVRESLAEREILLQRAAYMVTPLKFILPYISDMRPYLVLRLGLFFYGLLARGSQLPKPKAVQLDALDSSPLKANYRKGFSYYDCQCDDSRLVIANALLAAKHGARIHTRTRCVQAKRDKDSWLVTLSSDFGHTYLYRTKALINAAGPWLADVNHKIIQDINAFNMRMVQGSHIVVPALYPEEQAYILQNTDKRIVFTIPYQEKFTLIGTTDTDFSGNPADSGISKTEVDYLLKLVARYFNKSVTEKDIVWEFSGIRALVDDNHENAASIKRGCHLELNDDMGQLPVISIVGGKLTSARALAEKVMHRLGKYFPKMGGDWTAKAPLPGGDIPNQDMITFKRQLKKAYPCLLQALLDRYAGLYGSRTYELLKHMNTHEDLGEYFGAGLYAREIDFLMDTEWACTTEDIVWRRTKLGLTLTEGQLAAIDRYLRERSK